MNGFDDADSDMDSKKGGEVILLGDYMLYIADHIIIE